MQLQLSSGKAKLRAILYFSSRNIFFHILRIFTTLQARGVIMHIGCTEI